MRTLILLVAACAPLCSQVRIPGPGGMAAAGGTGSSGPCSPAAGYAHCRTLTINHAQVGGSTLSTFGVLVRGSLGASRVQNANCYDVIFTLDSGGASLIPWEMESCSASTGTIVMWAGLPSISATVDTTFYVSYDNASITTPQNTGAASPASVWNNNYALVHHLGNGSTLSVADSTTNANHGTNAGGTATTGEIGGAAAFSGTSQDYSVANSASLNNWTNLTISFWIKGPAAQPNYYSRIIEKGVNSEVTILTNFAGTMDGKVYLQNLGTSATGINTNAAVLDNAWHYVVVQLQYGGGSNSTAQIYIDGNSSAGPAAVGALTFARTGNIFVGASNGASNFLQASLDELHYQTVITPVGWIAAEFASQQPNSTFLTMGTEI